MPAGPGVSDGNSWTWITPDGGPAGVVPSVLLLLLSLESDEYALRLRRAGELLGPLRVWLPQTQLQGVLVVLVQRVDRQTRFPVEHFDGLGDFQVDRLRVLRRVKLELALVKDVVALLEDELVAFENEPHVRLLLGLPLLLERHHLPGTLELLLVLLRLLLRFLLLVRGRRSRGRREDADF